MQVHNEQTHAVGGLVSVAEAIQVSAPPSCWCSSYAERCPRPRHLFADALRCHTFPQAGFTSIDTALSYLDQGGVGAGIMRAVASGAVTREDLYVITKIPACLSNSTGRCGAETIAAHTTNLLLLGLPSVR